MQFALPLKKRVSLFATLVLLYAVTSLIFQIRRVVPPKVDNDDVASQAQETRTRDGRPLLRDVLSFPNGTIIGSPQFLLDFAIIGFPKCGSTAIHHWMGLHPQIHLLENEVFSLMNGSPERLIYRLYTQLPAESNIRRGFKNPLEIRSPHSLAYIKKYFPKTLLIIGIRSSVKWFESLYNFKVRITKVYVEILAYSFSLSINTSCKLISTKNLDNTNILYLRCKIFPEMSIQAIGVTRTI